MKKATQAVHAGKRHSVNQGGVVTPIFTSTAISYMDDSEVRYPRYFNTINSQVTADKLACLEESEAAIVTSSGMGAISSVMLALLKPGDHVVVLEGLYGGSHALVLEEFQRLGIEWSFVAADPDSMRSAFQPNSRMVYVESPTNPLLRVLNLKEVASLAKSNRAISVIDGTFATPILQNPIALGFDIVLHSGTKYLGGHSDLVAGAVVSSAERIERLFYDAYLLNGATLAPWTAWLLLRGMRTLPARLRQHEADGLEVAEFLELHPGVARVHHPVLTTEPELVERQLRGFSGTFSFELATDEFDRVSRFIDALRRFRIGVSWGGVESLVISPARPRAPSPLVRLSIGLEGAGLLIADLEQALDAA